MKSTITWAVAIIVASAAVFATGMWVRGTPSLMTRVDDTLQQATDASRTYASDPQSVQAVVLSRTIASLKTANFQSLEHPHVVAAYVVDRPDKPRRLVVTWVSARPLADGVRIITVNSEAADVPANVPIPLGQITANQQQALQKVVYTVMLDLAPGSPQAALLTNFGDKGSPLRVALTRDGRITSNETDCVLAKDGRIDLHENEAQP